jgi:hypothetical protein
MKNWHDYRWQLAVLPLLSLSALPQASALAQSPGAKSTGDTCDRACLEAVARTYIDGLVNHSGKAVLLSPTVRRTENALTNARGSNEVRESFARVDMIEGARDIHLYTDVAKGEVVAFFVLDIDLKDQNGGGSASTKAGNSEYKVSVTKPAGTYSVHEAERFMIRDRKISEIEIIAHVEDGKGQGSGWPVERLVVVKPTEGARP